jgi:phage major head subunit gpT-like protein
MVCSRKPLTPDNYAEARAALLDMTRDYGGKLALTADLLMVPSALEGTANRILNAELVGKDGVTETNVWKGTCKPFPCPWLAAA